MRVGAQFPTHEANGVKAPASCGTWGCADGAFEVTFGGGSVTLIVFGAVVSDVSPGAELLAITVNVFTGRPGPP